MSELKFQGWGKIPRLNREMVVTEKIDGTQAAIGIVECGKLLWSVSYWMHYLLLRSISILREENRRVLLGLCTIAESSY